MSRTKVQSLVSAPTAIPSDIGLESAFQTRVVVQDHRKSALPVLADLDHALVVDLIDERLGLLRTATGLVTESLYLRESTAPPSRYEKVPDDQKLRSGGPFACALRELAEALSGVPRIVLHESLWATTASDGATLPQADASRRRNAWLERAYELFREAFPHAGRVVPTPEAVVADPEHRWGLAPFHYVPHYYDDVAHKLRQELAL